MLIRKRKVLQFIAELKALVPLYRETWMAISLSCQPIEPEKAAAIKTAYAVLSKPEPEIFFCASPMTALDVLCNQLWRLENQDSISNYLEQQFWQLPRSHIEDLLWRYLGASFMKDDGEIQAIQVELGCGEQERQRRKTILEQRWGHHWGNLTEAGQIEDVILWHELLWSDFVKSNLSEHFNRRMQELGFDAAATTSKSHPAKKLRSVYEFPIQTEIWAYYACWLDLCSSVFDFIQFDDRWNAMQKVVKQCVWLYPLEKFCIVCARPRILSLDHSRTSHSVCGWVQLVCLPR